MQLSHEDRGLVLRVQASKLTYLGDKKLSSLVSTCRSIEERNISGLFLEAGCALGGSSILIASLKTNVRPLYVYDVFGMIPPPTSDDTEDVHRRYKAIKEGSSKGIDGDEYYGYVPNLYSVVQHNLKAFGIDCEEQSVFLIKGLIQNTMNIDEEIAFAHIDVDWYEPVRVCLQRIYPNLAVGGAIILDDYHDWGGCRRATDEYLKQISGRFEIDDSAGSMKVVKLEN